jgi:hypothetical protein
LCWDWLFAAIALDWRSTSRRRILLWQGGLCICRSRSSKLIFCVIHVFHAKIKFLYANL